MTAEIGHLALVIAFAMTILQSVIPLVGYYKKQVILITVAKSLVWGQFFFTIIAFLLLTHGFLKDDFTIAYVANNSNQATPYFYKISAVWGAHEGSLSTLDTNFEFLDNMLYAPV